MLPEFVGTRLKPLKVDLPPSWQLWQYKSLNMHRGVIHWDATSVTCTLPEIREQIRRVVRDHFRPSWWRGFGFGAIISLNHVDDSFKDAVDVVDVRNNSKGVWQWIVLHFPMLHAAAGICTWTEGYLAPVYRDLLCGLQNSGFSCESYRKDMDALMKGLLAIQRKLSPERAVLGGLKRLLG
jgi:hypothetical protein